MLKMEQRMKIIQPGRKGLALEAIVPTNINAETRKIIPSIEMRIWGIYFQFKNKPTMNRRGRSGSAIGVFKCPFAAINNSLLIKGRTLIINNPEEARILSFVWLFIVGD